MQRESTEKIVARLARGHFLDRSFNDNDFQVLEVESITLEKSLAQYEASGGETLVRETMRGLPYEVPDAGTHEVISLNFSDIIDSSSNEHIKKDEVTMLMRMLGVRPIPHTHLIQYGAVFPDHQKRNTLTSLEDVVMHGRPYSTILFFDRGKRILDPGIWRDIFDSSCRFLVTPM